LFDLGVADDRFAMLWVEHLGHRVFDLVDELVNDRVKFDLHAFTFRHGHSACFDLYAESDHDCI